MRGSSTTLVKDPAPEQALAVQPLRSSTFYRILGTAPAAFTVSSATESSI